jgi:membrane protease YdiL (CAAX protease family)
MSTNLGDTNGTAAQAPARVRAVNWREVILFALLTYGLAWAWWGFWLFPYLGALLTQSTTSTDLVAQAGGALALAIPLGMFAPMIAALIMRLFVNKEGVKGSLGLLRSWRYYLAALVAPVVFVTAVVLIVQALGLGEFRWSQAGWLVYLTLMLKTLPNIPFTFGEEYGWRGYLLPRLLPLGEIRATLLVGLIWGPWHVPFLLAGLNYPGVNFWVAFLVFCFTVVVLSFAYTWFYVASSGSVVVVALLHQSFNTFSDTFWQPPLMSEGSQLAASVVVGVVMVALVVVVYGLFKRPVHVEDPEERFVHPKLDRTWRDWVR